MENIELNDQTSVGTPAPVPAATPVSTWTLPPLAVRNGALEAGKKVQCHHCGRWHRWIRWQEPTGWRVSTETGRLHHCIQGQEAARKQWAERHSTPGTTSAKVPDAQVQDLINPVEKPVAEAPPPQEGQKEDDLTHSVVAIAEEVVVRLGSGCLSSTFHFTKNKAQQLAIDLLLSAHAQKEG